MRVRGLKLESHTLYGLEYSVAPHAGAWIETWREDHLELIASVAPHAGAWIETTYRHPYQFGR